MSMVVHAVCKGCDKYKVVYLSGRDWMCADCLNQDNPTERG